MSSWFFQVTRRQRSGRSFTLEVAFILFLGVLLWGVLTGRPGMAQLPSTRINFTQIANSVEDLQKQQVQLEQQRSQVSKERDRLQDLEKSAHGRIKGLQQTIKTTAAQIKVSEAQLEASIKQLRKLETVLVAAEQGYQQKQNATVARLRFLQRQQVERGWAVLLQSQNLNEFLDRRYQLRRVYGADRKILADLKRESDRIEQQRDQVEQKKNEIALIRQQLLANKLESEAEVENQKALVARLKTDRRALEVAEAQLLQDSETISVLIQQRARRNGVIALRGTGQFIYPCTGEITSGFGWRMHPLLGYQRFHGGIDFGADYGTSIHAADSGTVIFAGWYGGYGNAVIVDHGNGLTSLYAHSSELYVAEGQTVQRGQAIAAVGSTGLSTGPHLHFEVRQNGEPVDPMAYL